MLVSYYGTNSQYHVLSPLRYIVVPPVVPVDPSSVVTPAVDHVVVVLSTLLSGPVPARDRFLAALLPHPSPERALSSEDEAANNQWTFLEKEDDDEETSAADRNPVEFLESDLLAFLARVPFYDVVRQIFGVVGDGSPRQVVIPPDENAFVTVLSISSRLVEIFRAGLSTYARQRYRNFGKLLCRFLAHLALFVGDQFEALVAAQNRSRESDRQLQADYDDFFERVFLAIQSARRFGSWQFLSQLNYKMVSLDQLLELKTIALCVRFPLPMTEEEDSPVDQGKGNNSMELFSLFHTIQLVSVTNFT